MPLTSLGAEGAQASWRCIMPHRFVYAFLAFLPIFLQFGRHIRRYSTYADEMCCGYIGRRGKVTLRFVTMSKGPSITLIIIIVHSPSSGTRRGFPNLLTSQSFLGVALPGKSWFCWLCWEGRWSIASIMAQTATSLLPHALDVRLGLWSKFQLVRTVPQENLRC